MGQNLQASRQPSRRSATLTRRPGSECVFSRQLKNARVQRALDSSESRRIQTRLRRIEVRMVQDVKEFEPQFHALAFTNLEVSRQAAVHIEVSRSNQRV